MNQPPPPPPMQIMEHEFRLTYMCTQTLHATEPFQPIINLSRMLGKHPVSLIAAGSRVPRCSEPGFIIQLLTNQFGLRRCSGGGGQIRFF
ncbi:hypothetical protein Zmor_000102 [Zophobas morio]|uniref:Uncharacterized protein n=1 Tax=Zophobas morio TaxID=2755281 RepID=A0AA38J4S4_9CUCU|nr:hypothetical protein Zmor_000102 [Zophobas morio]